MRPAFAAPRDRVARACNTAATADPPRYHPPVLALDVLKSLSESLGRDNFVTRYPMGFLVRRAAAGSLVPGAAHNEEPGSAALAFKTSVVDRRSLRAMLTEDEDTAEDPADWTVIAVEKRRGNPYPERISIGRATNCDIVLRVEGISKLHAHLIVADGVVDQIVDQNSANGTYVNATRLTPGQPAALVPGDKLRFGALEVEFVGADALWHELTRR